ncbi:hypothetical protein KDD93_03465 [Campylobacter sp. faydin G-24]|uniref:Uncharacterized protein n=1 Tax=Campylobacter anatolicus TaxID=2829105 RepID=A0ABS5HH78_9BACT|nr:hypothetical protein [Campylobacter anatolicus]MBR8463631.1 hypothetical protein [Campylobacter anatolicus]
MLYVETGVAADVFGVGISALKEATRRNSQKYPFIRITDAKTRSRGGVKLLFEVEVADISSAIRLGKVKNDITVYMFENGEYMPISFNEIKEINTSFNNIKDDNNAYYKLSDDEKTAIDEKIKLLKE